MARISRVNKADTPAPHSVITYDTWIYARLSLDSDSADESVENQIAIATDYIGGCDDLNYCGAFSDTGYTGTDFDRPDFIKLMGAINGGAVKRLVVKDLSRVGRTYIEVGEFLFDTLPAQGIRFVSINDNYDSFADDAARKKLLILFKNLINHMYSRDLGKKIRSAHDAKKKRGEPAGQAPYGYKKSKYDTQLYIDGDAAEIVRKVFEMRLNGISASSIAKHLTANNIPSPQQRRYELGEIKHEKYSSRIVWSAGLVSRMLHNETYTGCLIQGKYYCEGKKHNLLPRDQWIRHENKHPAIISRELFDDVQALLVDTAEKYKKPGVRKSPDNIYVGKVFCTRCGKATSRASGGAVTRERYYFSCRHCANDLKRELDLKRVPQLTLDKLNTIVSQSLRIQMAKLGGVENTLKKLVSSDIIKKKNTELARERRKYEAAVASADKIFAAAYTHYLDGILDLREFEAIRDKSATDKDAATAQLAATVKAQNKYAADKASNNAWRVEFGNFRKFNNLSKELIQALVKRINVTPLTNEVIVELNFMDSFAELQELFEESGVSVNG